MNEQDRKSLGKWMEIFAEADAAHGKTDQDDMSWWRDRSTTLDENVRVRVYDWDADTIDVLTMTRRCAIKEGHITTVTAEEAELLKAEGFELPAGTTIVPTPATASAPVAEQKVTLADVVAQGIDLQKVEVRTIWGKRVMRILEVTPTLIVYTALTSSGKEVEGRSLPSIEVEVVRPEPPVTPSD